MPNNKKLSEFSVISLIIFLSSSFLIILSYILASDIPLISSLLKNYLISGNSFFFPTLPKTNILWFLPKKFQIFPITIGQCIDLIIILNLTCYLESLIYHYIKWTILNKNTQITLFLESFYLNNNDRTSEMGEEIDSLNDLSIGIIREQRGISFLIYKMDWKSDTIYQHVKIKKNKNRLNYNRNTSGLFKLTLNNYINFHLFYCYYSIFVYFWNILSKVCYSPPDMNKFVDYMEDIGGKIMLKIALMVFCKIFGDKKEYNLLLKGGYLKNGMEK